MAFEILDQANTPHFTTQENLWFIFQEVKKKKKRDRGLVLLCSNQNPVNSMMGN